MRIYYDHALIVDFQRQGIDNSAVHVGKAINFTHPVRYNIMNHRQALSAEIPLKSKTPPLPSALVKGGVLDILLTLPETSAE